MARKSDSYPKEFAQLFRHALRQEMKMELPSANDATALAHQLHAYRRAVEKEDAEQGLELRKITIRVRGAFLIANVNPILASISNALAGADEPSEQELEDYLNKLMEGEDNAGAI